MSETTAPPMKSRRLFPAAVLGLAAVALGALGTHGLRVPLDQAGTLDMWKTANQYHFIHVLVLLFLALDVEAPCWIGALFMGGVLCFSGSLYAYALVPARWLMFFTPLGGALFLAGWLGLAAYAWRLRSAK